MVSPPFDVEKKGTSKNASGDSVGHFLEGLELDQCPTLSIPSPPLYSPSLSVNHRALQASDPLPLADASNSKQRVQMDRKTSKRREDPPSRIKQIGRASAGASNRPMPLETPIRKKRKCGDGSELARTPCSTKRPLSGTEIDILTPEKAATSDLSMLESLVRAYTLLPYEERQISDAANAIRSLGEYPLVPAIPEGMDLTTDEKQGREKCIRRMRKTRDDIKFLEEERQSEARVTAQITRCLHRRHGGCYRYFNVDTGRPVTWQEYEERYLLMLEEVNAVRGAEWARYFAEIDEEGAAQYAQLQSECKTKGSRDNEESTGGKPLGSGDEEEAGSGLFDSEQTPKQTPLSENSSARLTSTEHVPKSLGVSPPSYLPFPSREERSGDPRVARLQEQLWSELDAALERYSRAVVSLASNSAANSTSSDSNL